MEELKARLSQTGISTQEAEKITAKLKALLETLAPEQCWQQIIKESLNQPYPFPTQLLLYKTIFPHWDKIPCPAWLPDEKEIKTTHIAKLMDKLGFTSYSLEYQAFHRWSVENYSDFWQIMSNLLNIKFDKPFTQVVDLSKGIEEPLWFSGATLNIINSCFQANKKQIALISQTEQGQMIKTTYEALDKFSNRIANSLKEHIKKGSKAAIIMPMTLEAVAIFLALIKAGCIVVAIPDSFSSKEIETRLQITDTSLVFCQDHIIRDTKILPLYEKIVKCKGTKNIVLAAGDNLALQLREQDLSWEQFLSTDEDMIFTPVSSEPNEPIIILFSSGTSGTPKAIPWTQSTAIKCASDAYLHHDLHENEVFCWPSNLGWMMGPWLIFACLLNKACIALYSGVPYGTKFGQFIQDSKVSHLGVVPTMVKQWRTTACMENLNWQSIKLFSSTGERSNVEDMLYLMSLAEYRPIIEYCGGTEIGGAYLTGTLLQPAAPAAFTTAALGLDFVLLDERGMPVNKGEVAIIPPSIGLSSKLLNQNHHQIYYANMPKYLGTTLLRRHGDQIEHYSNGFYRLLGRVDDVMKLSGIKVSSAEIESCLQAHPAIDEVAAVAVNPPDGGPTQLVIFTVLKEKIELAELKHALQDMLKLDLNPLFKIHEVISIPTLPRTASHKILRRVLREQYSK